MNHKVLIVALLVALAVGVSFMIVSAQGPKPTPPKPKAPTLNAGTAFTYQGQLKNNGALVNGTCAFNFGLWDASTLGNQVSTTQTVSSLSVMNGLFATQVDFGPNAFTGDARWLAIAVNCGAGLTLLNPREALTPAPIAFSLPGLYTQQNATSPNVIGGYSGNTVDPSTHGATIGGGGESGFINHVSVNGGTIGGGAGNIASGLFANVGGGYLNTASNVYATVSGGSSNTASSDDATIGGGNGNTSSNFFATVGGGVNNVASGAGAFVGGGGFNGTVSNGNTASGNASTIPGGFGNSATMNYTFAAGRRAKAVNQGAFVWGDSTDQDFSSTANDQFLIRANGGMGVNTNSPAANTLTVGGNGLRVATDGTTFTRIQSGTSTLGQGISGVNTFTVTFPSAFSVTPKVNAIPRAGGDYADTFAVTVRNVSTTQFSVNVYRVDLSASVNGWGQFLQLDWFAWQ